MDSIQKRFALYFESAIDVTKSRLDTYRDTDPLTEQRLMRLKTILETQRLEVLRGEVTKYVGLYGPLKLVLNWGEPANSNLIDALNGIEEFFKANYSS